MKKTAEQLVADATAEIVTLSPQEALAMQQAGEAVLVDEFVGGSSCCRDSSVA